MFLSLQQTNTGLLQTALDMSDPFLFGGQGNIPWGRPRLAGTTDMRNPGDGNPARHFHLC